MRLITRSPKYPAPTRHRGELQVALPFSATTERPTLDSATRAEVVTALARMLVEAADAATDAVAEADDEA